MLSSDRQWTCPEKIIGILPEDRTDAHSQNHAMAVNPFEIVRRTPKTNCGRCGFPTCLAFAAAVSKTAFDPAACPHIDLTGLDLPATGQVPNDGWQHKNDLELIAHLKDKIATLNFARIAPRLGCRFSLDTPDTLFFRYIGQDVILSKNGILLNQHEPEDPRDQILLYNYVASEGGNPPTLDWVGMESLPNSISKIRTLSTYCEQPLARLFAGQPSKKIMASLAALDGTVATGHSAACGAIIPVLPRIRQYLLFWDVEPVEAFDAKVKVLFDCQVLTYLDLESLVFSSERLAERITLLWDKGCTP